MSRDTALDQAQRLKAVLERHGVKVSIELQEGRPWAGDYWYSAKHVLMNHHTAGSATGLTPSLALVKRGRGADLPGPLCNGYGGRDHVFRIITMGLANHPGAGGPMTLAGFTVPKDSARISTFGIEWEHDGVSDWSAEMREFMGRVGAGVLDYLAAPVGRSCEHKTWAPKRKIDRNDFTAATGQDLIRKWADAGPGEDDDVTPEQLRAAVKAVLEDKSLIDNIDSTGKVTGTMSVVRAHELGDKKLDTIGPLIKLVTAIRAELATTNAAVAQLLANSPEGVRTAFEEGRAALQQDLADLDVHVVVGTDPSPKSGA